MKVLLASPVNRAGGIARWTEHILNHYNNLASSKIYEMEHLSMSAPDSRDIIHRSLWHRIKKGVRSYFIICKHLYKLLNAQAYDLLHFTSSASISLIKDICMIQIAHRRRVKAIVHFHFGRIPQLKQQNNWEWKLLCMVAKMADMVIVIDVASYHTLLEFGFSNVSLLPNPVSPKVLEIAINAKMAKRQNRTILFVGHGVRTKGIYELIDACRNIPNIKVKMLGAILDSTKEELIRYSGQACWLDIQGEIPYEEVIKEMTLCDIFVLPTYTEGFPNVILESMACGCAIISTPVGAIPEMLGEEDGRYYGIMVEPRNVEQLKSAIERILSDAKFKKECRINAQQRVNERYNINAVWQQMTEIWENVIL